jgi:uncharacterized protein (TIGR02118 family)
MVKLIFLCRRRADVSHTAYAEMLLGDHVPIALRHHPALRKYIVNVVDHSPEDAPGLDSVGELSFDTLDDYRERLYDSPGGETTVLADVARFMGGADGYATTEYVHIDDTPAAPIGEASRLVKLVCPVRRREGLTHERFAEHWLGRHVPLARRHHPGLVKYVTNVVDERLSDDAEPWDGIAELYFASMRDLTERMYGSEDDERAIRADVARFIGHGVAYRVTQWVQKVV